MGPFIYNEQIVTDTLQGWFATSGELFAELYMPHSGSGPDFFLLSSGADYQDLMDKAKSGAYCCVFRDKQLSIRGIVDDTLISQSLEEVKEGQYYLVVKPCVYPKMMDFLGDGNTHAELRRDLESVGGIEVWVGHDFWNSPANVDS